MHRFRTQMKLYRASALKIQTWFRHDMKERVYYLKLKRSAIVLQRAYKLRFEQRAHATILIQKTWRMHACVAKYKKVNAAVLVIQNWWLNCREERLRFLKLKRSLPIIVAKGRDLVRKRNEAARVIQRGFRLYKFRREMTKYRNAALTIQKWTRSMSERYLYFRKRLAIIKIQDLYRHIYMQRRHSAAIHIQNAWRVFQAKKKVARERELHYMHQCAVRIQALWRGYAVRKRTFTTMHDIRGRLSTYGQRMSIGHTLTLGSRIRNSIRTLSEPCEIGRIIMALQDLQRVTSLSPECCMTFIREDAVEILYTFIETCNRSVPHMDLIRYCLQVG